MAPGERVARSAAAHHRAVKVSGGGQAAHESELASLGGGDAPSGEDEVKRVLGPHRPDERNSDHVWPQPDSHLGCPERRVVAGDNEVAGEGEAEAAGKGVALHAGDGRLA